MGPLVAFEQNQVLEDFTVDDPQVIDECVATRSPIIETGRPMS